MGETKCQAPLVPYAVAVGVFLVLLLWQTLALRPLEKQIREVPEDLNAFLESMEESSRAIRASQDLQDAYHRARGRFKFGFLLVIVFPVAVLFPAFLSRRTDTDEGPKVMDLDDMTIDELERQVEEPAMPRSAQGRLFAVNAAAFLLPLAICLLFLLWKPAAYVHGQDLRGGGVKTALFFAVSALMVFSGSAMAYPLRKKLDTTKELATHLGVGYVILGLLALLAL